MAHLTKDLDDIQIQWMYKNGKKAAELVSIDPETGERKSTNISVQAAEMLIEHGMSHGS